MFLRYSAASSVVSGGWLRYFSKRALIRRLSPKGMATPPTVMVSAEGSSKGISWPRGEAAGCGFGAGAMSAGGEAGAPGFAGGV